MKAQPVEVGRRVETLPAENKLAMSFITWAALVAGAWRSLCKVDVLRHELRISSHALADDARLMAL